MSDDSNLSMDDVTGIGTHSNTTPRINGNNDDISRRANTRPRNILEPIDRLSINAKKFTRFTQIELKDLEEDGAVANRKGFLDLQLLRIIANSRSKNQNQLKYYKAKDTSKKVSSFAYKRLFMLRIVNLSSPTDQLVYVVEDALKHQKLWNQHTCIRDNGGITIGTIFRFFAPKPIDNIMPDGIPSIESSFPVTIMKMPSILPEVRIDYLIEGGTPLSFSLNGCEINSLSIEPIETGCAGRFCDKQRVLEVLNYNEGCGCYSFDARRTNMVIDHAINIDHFALQETIHVPKFSSSNFSLFYQNTVFSPQVRTSTLDITDEFFELEDAVTQALRLINDNGGFTVIGWYKRGNIQDRTILHQNNNNPDNNKLFVNIETDTVDNSKIMFHPCVIRPSNDDFFDKTNDLFIALQEIKFDVSTLLK